MKTEIFTSLKSSVLHLEQLGGACFAAPTRAMGQAMLFGFGVFALVLGSMGAADAIGPGTYNDERIDEVLNRIFQYIEGAFGALLMTAAGIGAIFTAAIGQYRTSLGLLVVAVGAFILRSLISTFFDDTGIRA